MTATVRLPSRLYRQAALTSHYGRYRKVLTRPGTFVPGVGNVRAQVMFIGEAPGEEEDRAGEPFVGKAGGLLNEMLAYIKLSRDEVFITNLIKFRPAGNDMSTIIDDVPPAMTLMRWEIGIINPRIVVPLGRWASGLFFQDTPITQLAGQMYVKQNRAVFPMLHPSYVQRASIKGQYKEHFRALRDVITK